MDKDSLYCSKKNVSSTFDKGFFLLAFCNLYDIQILLFVAFFFIYLITFLGNLLMLVLAIFDPHLQTPMYFFLRNLSFVEFCYSSVILPRMLRDFSMGDRYISFIQCHFQMFFFCLLGTIECFLLGVMAYDRYAAICHPLQYSLLLTWNICHKLIIYSWSCSFLMSSIVTGGIFNLSYCGSRTIDHYFCEVLHVLSLSCSDKLWINSGLIFYDTLAAFIPFILILFSYVKILKNIFRLQYAERQKAFSTCSSHFLCVSLFYGSGMISYMIPKTLLPIPVQQVASLFYTIFIPMLNPIIYGLRNRDVKVSVKKLMSGKLSPCQ